MRSSRILWLGLLVAALIALALLATRKSGDHSAEAVPSPFTSATLSSDGSTITVVYSAASCVPYDHAVTKIEGEVIQLSIHIRATGQPCGAAATDQTVVVQLDQPHPNAHIIQGP